MADEEKEDKVRVRFIKPYVVKDKSGVAYAEGEEHEFPARSAQHFIRKGVAEDLSKPAKTLHESTLVKAAPKQKAAEADDAEAAKGGRQAPDAAKTPGKK
jgi:hypothetical protein